MLNRFSFARRWLCVCCLVVLAVVGGCSAVDSTSENGTALKAIITIPKPGTRFVFAFNGNSTGSTSATIAAYADTVIGVDSTAERTEVSLLNNVFLRPFLDVSADQMHYFNAFLLARLVTGIDEPITLPINSAGYSLTRDSLVTDNGFVIAPGTYTESTTRLGSSVATVEGKDYPIWSYMCVHGLTYTVSSTNTTSDTLYADFSPALGYFTRLNEKRIYREGGTFYGYEMIATLDTISVPK